MAPTHELERTVAPFVERGGRLVVSPSELAAAAAGVKALVLDWDGVFHAGRSDGAGGGTFSEPDSMGLNLLRYGSWLRSGVLPAVVIVSGRSDPTMLRFAEREHLTAVYGGVVNKTATMAEIQARFALVGDETAVVFDDVNDLGLSELCGLRFLVRRASSPLFERFARSHGLCHYVTGQDANNHALREICELLLGLWKNYESVVTSRWAFDEPYRTYWEQRNAVRTEFHAP